MKLYKLLSKIEVVNIKGNPDVDIEGITHDSRLVNKGWLFVAIKGNKTDGFKFIPDALSRGAVCIVTDNELRNVYSEIATWVQVKDARKTLSRLSFYFYGEPSEKMKVIGITGTNGKTTVSYILREIFLSHGMRPGLIGTVEYNLGNRSIPASRTTPDASDIHKMMKEMIDNKCDSCIMEVSSHGLAQSRVDDINFYCAIFTNLSHDHLDYHSDMESYFKAKLKLFQLLRDDGIAIINIDDTYGARIIKEGHIRTRHITYGINSKADIVANNIKLGITGTEINVTGVFGDCQFTTQLLGRHNVYNLLAGIACACSMGLLLPSVCKSLAKIASIRGRLERINLPNGAIVFVDYAHTDDALKNILQTLREISEGNLIVVFGCGGNRDRAKRPKMGKVAEMYADKVVVTSDNPRNENPSDIIKEILAGISDFKKVTVIEDRAEAIRYAISKVSEKDTVLIAGKGHECFQEFADRMIPFDDRAVVFEYIKGNEKK